MPLYKHDCDRCVFLGTEKDYDWYVCPQGGYPTVVRRESHQPEEYSSSDKLFDQVPTDEWKTRAKFLMRHWSKHYNRNYRMKLRRTIQRQDRRRRKAFGNAIGWWDYEE